MRDVNNWMKDSINVKLGMSGKFLNTYLPATHPGTERQLNVLPAPDVHSVIERPDVMEVVLPDGDGTTDQCRRPMGLGLVLQSSTLVSRHLHPHVPAGRKLKHVIVRYFLYIARIQSVGPLKAIYTSSPAWYMFPPEITPLLWEWEAF